MQPRVFVTFPAPPAVGAALRAVARTTIYRGRQPIPRGTLLEGVRCADGVLCLLTERIDAALLEQVPRLRAVANCAVGYDNVDLRADPSAASGGLSRLVLLAGDARRAKVLAKGKGPNLVLPALPVALPLRVQVRSSDTFQAPGAYSVRTAQPPGRAFSRGAQVGWAAFRCATPLKRCSP